MTVLLTDLGERLWHAHVTDLPSTLRRTGRMLADDAEWARLAMDVVEYCHPRGLLTCTESDLVRAAVARGDFGDATDFFADLLTLAEER
ncbi:hypothetical protein [Propionicicella superfundia]|uniref:hypothetical protein n=1 Tax=Propionicicella superfundia TaxID=348582 RepID=UPI0003FE347E|nr:hypothetical protein [Propionicicella superfundia]